MRFDPDLAASASPAVIVEVQEWLVPHADHRREFRASGQPERRNRKRWVALQEWRANAQPASMRDNVSPAYRAKHPLVGGFGNKNNPGRGTRDATSE